MVDSKVKDAFSSVKKDIEALNARISNLEKKIAEYLETNQKNSLEMEPKTHDIAKFEGVEANTSNLQVSIGNEGVRASKRATSKQASEQASNEQAQSTDRASNQAPTIQDLKDELEIRIQSLTKNEFIAFLSIYQLEEDLERGVTYLDLAKKLNLTENYIRALISIILQKKLPLVKKRLNNQITTLTIHPNFRELGIKDRLFRLFYDQDPDQTKLFDN
jgi:hypothetical protein